VSARSHRPAEKIALAAVALATAALWIAFGLHYESQRQLQQLIDTVGGNVFYAYRESRAPFSEADIASIRELLPNADVIGVTGTTRGISPDETYALTYVEAMDGYFDFFRLTFQHGGAFSSPDSHEAVLGAEVAHGIYGDADPIGRTLEGFTIVGVLEEIPSDDLVRRRVNAQIVVPLGMSPGMSFRPIRDPFWAVYIRSNLSMEMTVEKMRDSFPTIESTRTAHLHSLVFIAERITNHTLIVSALGMMLLAGTAVAGTAALCAVSRRREMGVRMAIGATSSGIFRELIRDIVELSLKAGAYGIAAGAILQGIAELLDFGLSVGPLHLIVLPTALTCGFLASLYPSWRTSMMRPVHALRGSVPQTASKVQIDAGHVLVALTLLVSTVSVLTFLDIGSGLLTEIRRVWGGVDDQLLVVGTPSESFLTPPFLTPEDRTNIEALPGIDTAIQSVNILAATRNPDSPYLMIRGVDQGYEDLKLLSIVQGRDLTAEELATGTRVAIISEMFAENEFGDSTALDRTLQTEDRSYTIVGVFASDMSHSFTLSQVVVPYRSLSRIDRELGSHDFFVRVSDGTSTALSADLIIARLKEVHAGRADVEVINPSDRQTALIVPFLALMARLMMLVGFGILLSLANAITHIRYDMALRSREISIRKAVGATDWDILKLGLGSALIPGIPAILFALLLGRFTTPLLADYLRRPDVGNSWAMSVLTVLVMTSIGVISGILAAWQSARMSPANGIQKGRT